MARPVTVNSKYPKMIHFDKETKEFVDSKKNASEYIRELVRKDKNK